LFKSVLTLLPADPVSDEVRSLQRELADRDAELSRRDAAIARLTLQNIDLEQKLGEQVNLLFLTLFNSVFFKILLVIFCS
jgi:hypothetical protein